MNLREFIINFAETYTVQHIDDVHEGIIQQSIAEDVYLVKNKGVSE